MTGMDENYKDFQIPVLVPSMILLGSFWWKNIIFKWWDNLGNKCKTIIKNDVYKDFVHFFLEA